MHDCIAPPAGDIACPSEPACQQLEHRGLRRDRGISLVARAVAGEPRILLADEPVAGLDPAHQLEVMAMLERMAAEGAAVVVVLHDLTLAVRHCNRLALLGGGRLVASGDADTVLSTEHLRDCFGIRALSGESADGPFVIPVARV